MPPRRNTATLGEYEDLAAHVLPRVAFDYFAGGAGEERTLRANEAAWSRRRLLPRVLVDVSQADTEITLLGKQLSVPFLVAPMALQRMAHSDGELGMAEAAAKRGVGYVMSTGATASIEDVASANRSSTRWYQLDLHRDRTVSEEAVERAASAGFGAIVLTVDSPVAARRPRDIRNDFTVPPHLDLPAFPQSGSRSGHLAPEEFFSIADPATTWSDLEQLVKSTPLPVLVKGILSPADADRACTAGAGGLIVSNHGGRQLDGAAATADVLQQIATAVSGHVPVLVDGGIRTGADVLVALALGADAVLIGRPFIWALAVDGRDGVEHAMAVLRSDLVTSLALLGCSSPSEVDSSHLAAA